MEGGLSEAEKFKFTESAEAAKQFAKLYYESYDKRRQALDKLYLIDATLIWNGNLVEGGAAISKYLGELTESRDTRVECVDCHPLPDKITQGQTSMVVIVMGNIKYLTKRPNYQPFTHTFFMTTQDSSKGKSWKIQKDVFRIIE